MLDRMHLSSDHEALGTHDQDQFDTEPKVKNGQVD